jgi:hypothetical protein
VTDLPGSIIVPTTFESVAFVYSKERSRRCLLPQSKKPRCRSSFCFQFHDEIHEALVPTTTPSGMFRCFPCPPVRITISIGESNPS